MLERVIGWLMSGTKLGIKYGHAEGPRGNLVSYEYGIIVSLIYGAKKIRLHDGQTLQEALAEVIRRKKGAPDKIVIYYVKAEYASRFVDPDNVEFREEISWAEYQKLVSTGKQEKV